MFPTIQGLSGTLGQLSNLQGSLSGMQQQLGQLLQMSAVLDNADELFAKLTHY